MGNVCLEFKASSQKWPILPMRCTSKRNHLVALIILDMTFVLMNTTAMISSRDVTLALHSSTRAATVAELQRPSFGWRNIHSRHRLIEAYYYSTCLIEGIVYLYHKKEIKDKVMH